MLPVSQVSLLSKSTKSVFPLFSAWHLRVVVRRKVVSWVGSDVTLHLGNSKVQRAG